MLSAAQPTCFLIADISGYTGYLADVELDHAQDILADLIGAVVTALRPGFRLAKLEGDAAFTYAVGVTIDGSGLDGADLGLRPHVETYDRLGDVHAWVLDLERRWQEEEARARVFVTPA